MNTYFCKNDWIFELTTPEYEISTFGDKIGELRKVDIKIPNKNVFELDEIDLYCKTNNILSCTFRGKEDINIVRYLNSIGFQFVSTFYTLSCDRSDFKRIDIENDLNVIEATEKDFDRILEIESKVFDYSTYQIDPLFSNDITSKRNVKRVKFYFSNPNHHTFIIMKGTLVIGFIQFLYDNILGIAYAENGAVDPDFHERFVGTKLYSEAFVSIFNSGINKIMSAVSAQNVRALKIHLSTNFKIINQEIHLRWKK
jgi:ribosomal protein S18 acetylase RimI-like enzyme